MKNLPATRFPHAARWLCVLVLCLLAVHAHAVTLTTLYNFPADLTFGESNPSALVQGTDGNFYGTNAFGGPHGTGTAFKLTPAGIPTQLHGFSGRDAHNENVDGEFPSGSLTPGGDGNFYGVALSGGREGYGTAYKVTPAGALTVLHSFGGGPDADGTEPAGALLHASDGNFYGTTSGGGDFAYGTVFKLTPAGVETVLYAFDGSGGTRPYAGVVQDGSGNFYGTTEGGGDNDLGSVFKLTAAGVPTLLHSFGGSDDGYGPRSALVLGTDGSFYGTTPSGGQYGAGTVFRVTPAGGFTTLHHFNPGSGDGDGPAAGLLLAKNGYLYGTTEFGGANGTGTIFRMTTAGVLKVFYSFAATDSNDANAGGAFPVTSLIEGTDSNFYGSTYDGGMNGYGTVFKFDILPRITSPAKVFAVVNQAFSYQITATQNPTRFGVLGLPPGFQVNPTTGVITGTPSKVTTLRLTITASNAEGKTTAPLQVIVKVPPPVITSPTSLTVKAGTRFTYQITATGNPTQYYVSIGRGVDLHSFDRTTGLLDAYIGGTGTYQIIVGAYNAGGGGQTGLTITAQ